MRVPKIFFRNVPTEPRKFKFRSPYYDPQKEEIEKRRKRLEQEVLSAQEKEGDQPLRNISFDRKRRAESKKDGRYAMLRTVGILIVLFYLLFKGIQWADKTDFGNIIDIFKNG